MASIKTMNDHSPTAADRLIQETLIKMRKIVPKGCDVVFFDYAVFRNVGDLLITKGIEAFFEINGNRVLDCFCMQNHEAALGRTFPADAVFVFQGGGNFGDLFPVHTQIRIKILLAHPDQRAVILPQTLYYQDKANLAADAQALSTLENLTICMRDRISFEVAKTWFSNDLYLLPDTAHFLQDSFGIADPGNSTLNFLRVDQGSCSVTGLDALPDDRSSLVDWPNFLTPFEVAGIRRFQQIHMLDSRYGHTRLPYVLWKPFRNKLLNRASKLFLNSGEIVTNRLHGLIFSIICRRQTTIIETGYGKVSAYYDTWLEEFDTVALKDTDAHHKAMVVMKK